MRNIWWRTHAMKLLIIWYTPVLFYSLSVLLSTHSSKFFNLWSSPRIRYQILLPYKITDNIRSYCDYCYIVICVIFYVLLLCVCIVYVLYYLCLYVVLFLLLAPTLDSPRLYRTGLNYYYWVCNEFVQSETYIIELKFSDNWN